VARFFICRSFATCLNEGRGNDKEKAMSLQSLSAYSIAALAGGTMLALATSPASAVTLSGPSLEQSVASAQIDKVWYRYGYRGYGWRGGYYHRGWGYGRRCWRGYYGRLVCN
jgi:hypothetical protein